MFATRRRFYAVVLLSTRKEDDLTGKFFSSLTLPEKVAQPQIAGTTAEKPGIASDVAPSSKPARGDSAEEALKQGAPAPPTPAAGDTKPDTPAPTERSSADP